MNRDKYGVKEMQQEDSYSHGSSGYNQGLGNR